jgi:hypothetical protein
LVAACAAATGKTSGQNLSPQHPRTATPHPLGTSAGSPVDPAEDVLGEGGERLLTEMNNSELLRFVALDINATVEN